MPERKPRKPTVGTLARKVLLAELSKTAQGWADAANLEAPLEERKYRQGQFDAVNRVCVAVGLIDHDAPIRM